MGTTVPRVAAAGLAAAVALAGCGAGRVGTERTVTTPQGPAPKASAPSRPTTRWVAPAGTRVVALARPASVAVYPRPSTALPARWTLANPNELGARLVFLVTARRTGWVQVSVPVRPNGSTGWVPAAELTLRVDPYRLAVSESRHWLTVLRYGRPMAGYPVAVGASYAPTPTGHYYLTELLHSPDSTGPYGPWAYGTSAFSNVYSEFEGGPGQIGLHGTNEPWSIGQSASHGCVRMFDADVAKLAAYVPVGTPIDISA